MTRKIPPLSQREDQVWALIAEGYPNRDIAVRLKLTLNTVKAYIGTILLKKGCDNRTELAALYFQGASARPTRANHPTDPLKRRKGKLK